VFRGGVLDARKYFDPTEWEGRDLLSPEEYYQEIKDAFSRNLPRYFSGDQKVAMSLTGGLDGRMIMAWHRAAPGTLPCYTFGGMFRETRDVSLARQVAQACGQPHAVIEVGREFLSQFPTYAERTIYLTDGCVEVSHSPDLYAHVKARGIAPVRMTGNYGGEVLRGVWSFKHWEPPHGLFQEEFVSYIQQARMAYGSRNGKPISEVIFREIPAHLFGQFALDETQITLRSPYFDNELIRAVLRGSRHGSVENSEICHRLVLEGNEFLNEIPLDRKQREEGLLAICRGQVLEFLFKAEYAYDAGMPHWMARLDRAFSWFNLEQLFLGRHKWYHFRTWYKGALSWYVREMLLDERTLSRPYINRHSLDAIVKGHLSGEGNYTAEIHKILTIELIQRQLIET
jgi:asparagine synthase (glutamine-hydrolysing)